MTSSSLSVVHDSLLVSGSLFSPQKVDSIEVSDSQIYAITHRSMGSIFKVGLLYQFKGAYRILTSFESRRKQRVETKQEALPLTLVSTSHSLVKETPLHALHFQMIKRIGISSH